MTLTQEAKDFRDKWQLWTLTNECLLMMATARLLNPTMGGSSEDAIAFELLKRSIPNHYSDKIVP